jgi:D-tyrosyl-tRNA(Tyr) deacylase
MRIIIQRVSSASVEVDSNIIASIQKGFLVLLGIEADDSAEDSTWLVQKIAAMRIFPDDDGKMNRDILEANGDAIVVSQFTLHASTKKGNRPSFIRAARPEQAIPLYEDFVKQLEAALNKKVGTGVFGADMKVALVNDGPVTISMDSKNRE